MPVSSSTSANLSSPCLAKRPDRDSCSVDSTWTFQCLPLLNTGRLRAFLARLQSTIGGLSDTELKLLAVMPTGEPSSAWVVMMVTPVVKVPSAVRNACGSKLVCSAMTGLMDWICVLAVFPVPAGMASSLWTNAFATTNPIGRGARRAYRTSFASKDAVERRPCWAAAVVPGLAHLRRQA
ncbi:hypothetical protein D3C76_294040 [compost metagenome]